MDSRVANDWGNRCELLCDLLAMRLGLYFPPERWRDLERRIATAAPQLGYRDSTACLDGLLSGHLGRKDLEILASHLTVGESYFFRDPDAFAALQQFVLPDLVRRRGETSRRIRVWSAGCSSGEEAYSLAMALMGFLNVGEQWHVSIVATDINPHALAIARDGVYGNWSFRIPTPEWAQHWLVLRPDGRRAVAPGIKSMVTFGWLNLMDDPYPSIETNTNAIDVIFCRNVLMYFHPERVRQVLERLAACLLDDGWLVVSPVEASLVTTPLLTACRLPGTVFFRKVADGALSAPEPATIPLPTVLPAEPPISPGIPDDPAHRALAHPIVESAAAAPLVDAGTPMLQQARGLANRGLLAESLAMCDMAISHDRLDAGWTYLRASVLIELGEIEDAMAALRRSIYLDHGFVMPLFVLANLLLSRGRRKEARLHFRNALELLAKLDAEEALPEADGITAGRLAEIVLATLAEKAAV